LPFESSQCGFEIAGFFSLSLVSSALFCSSVWLPPPVEITFDSVPAV